MPKKIKDENGNEIDVYTQEEVEAAKLEAAKPLSMIKEKFGISDTDDFDSKIEGLSQKVKATANWELIKEGKEQTKTKAQEEVIDKLRSQGINAIINDKGEVVVDNNPSQPQLTQAEIEAAAQKVLMQHEFSKEKNKLLSRLDEAKRADVEKQINTLKDAGVAGDAKQLFDMSLAALGVSAPANFNNQQNGYPNGLPFDNNMFQNEKRGDFADSAAAKQIMRNMGMSDDLIKRSSELSSSDRIIKEGRMTNEGGTVNTYNDLNK